MYQKIFRKKIAGMKNVPENKPSHKTSCKKREKVRELALNRDHTCQGPFGKM